MFCFVISEDYPVYKPGEDILILNELPHDRVAVVIVVVVIITWTEIELAWSEAVCSVQLNTFLHVYVSK